MYKNLFDRIHEARYYIDYYKICYFPMKYLMNKK